MDYAKIYGKLNLIKFTINIYNFLITTVTYIFSSFYLQYFSPIIMLRMYTATFLVIKYTLRMIIISILLKKNYILMHMIGIL